jgi:hypothetical protein
VANVVCVNFLFIIRVSFPCVFGRRKLSGADPGDERDRYGIALLYP